MIRSVSTVTAARANVSSVFQLFSFHVDCSGMISKRLGFVAFLLYKLPQKTCVKSLYWLVGKDRWCSHLLYYFRCWRCKKYFSLKRTVFMLCCMREIWIKKQIRLHNFGTHRVIYLIKELFQTQQSIHFD